VTDVQLSTRGLLLIAAGVLSLWLLFRLWEVFVVIAAGFIFMSALLPYVDWLVRRGVNRVIAALLLLLAFLVVLGALGALVVPALIDEARNVRDSLPEDARHLDEALDRFGIDLGLEERARDLDWGELISGRAAIDYGQRAIVAVVSLVSIVVITVYLLIDAPRMAEFVYRFVPPGREPAVDRLLTSLRVVVGGYIRGQVITSFAIAAFTAGVMFALGLPNALAFGVLAAFFDIIPLIGATLAIAPPVFIALQESPTAAIIVLAALLAYQQFEDRFLTPRVYGKTLNLPPIIVLAAVLIGAELFGATGVLMALPAAAVARVLVDFYLERRPLAPSTAGAAEELLAPDARTATPEEATSV